MTSDLSMHSKRTKPQNGLSRWLKPILLPVLFLIFWQWQANAIDNMVILPTLGEVVAILAKPFDNLLRMGSMMDSVGISLVRVLIAYFTAILLAVPLGMFIGYFPGVRDYLSFFIHLFKPIAPLAWVPLVLAWFGISSIGTLVQPDNIHVYSYLHNIKLSMLFIIAIGAFFPILTNTIFGVSTVRETLIDAARTLGASNKDLFLKVLLPASLPSIVTGLKTGLGIAWMCLVSAEMLPGSMAGVGYLITHAYSVARTDVVIAGMIAISIIGGMIDWIFNAIESRFFGWKKKET